jgi:hypothetical protein
MSQSSPEGVILGKGSRLESLELSINEEKVLSIKQQEKLYSEEDMRKAIQETIGLMRDKASEFREHENNIIKQFKKK